MLKESMYTVDEKMSTKTLINIMNSPMIPDNEVMKAQSLLINRLFSLKAVQKEVWRERGERTRGEN